MPTVFRVFATLLAGLLATAILPASAAAKDTLVIGSISRFIKEEMEKFGPLAGYLGPRLGAVGIHNVKIAVVTSKDEMAKRLQRGEIDIYIDSPFIVAEIGQRTGAKPFLRRWKKGVAEYHSLFFTRKDGGVRSLDDLRGRIVAFETPFSSSGYLLPKAMLLQRGYRLVELRGVTDSVPPDAIGYVFANDDVNTMFWVDRGRVTAGATDPGLFGKFSDKNKGKYRVLARSRNIPRHVVVHRADLDSAVVRELERVLIAMDQSEAGREALQAFERTTRFDRFPDGVEATFGPIHEMLDLLGPGLTN